MEDNDLENFFQRIDDELNEAYEANDCTKLAKLLSDNWTILEPGIGVVGKNDFISAVSVKKLTHIAMKKKVVHVASFGNVAVIISRGRNIGQYEGRPFDNEVWVTNVYKAENSGWTCISTQEAPVPCK